MDTDANTKKCLTVGRRQASEILAYRDERLTKRGPAVAKMMRSTAAAAKPAAVTQKLMNAAGGAGRTGTLVAEGDSWFDYPWTDILGELEDDYGFDVESVAHKGDRVEDMAYGPGQLSKFTRSIERLVRRGIVPQAILLSGGGNDVAGDQFGTLLNHAKSSSPGLNDLVVDGLINHQIRSSFLTILSAVTQICKKRLGRPIPILTHGYDYPVPDGRGFLGGWWFLPGPWMEPGFRQKGYGDDDLPRRKKIARRLIDLMNHMLEEVVATPGLEHVRYVDLRGCLKTGPKYKDWWANELHPTGKGFAKVAERFAAEL